MYIALWINGNHTTPLKIPDYNNTNIIPVEKNGLRSRLSSTYPVTPPSWVAEFETTHGTNDVNQALDWNDLYLLVTPQPNGSNNVTFYAADGGAKNTNQVGGDQTFDLLDGNKNVVAANVTLGQTVAIPWGLTNYGANSRIGDLKFEATKIMLIDYCRTVVATTATDTSSFPYSVYCPGYPMGGPMPNGQTAPNRHKGTVNTLFCDGHVMAMTVTEIQPTDPTGNILNGPTSPGVLADLWYP
jgi:prepilin-type processing-associated H-X9-DG protein